MLENMYVLTLQMKTIVLIYQTIEYHTLIIIGDQIDNNNEFS